MAHSKQARKRLRQNEKQRLQNRLKLASMRTLQKRLSAAIAGGNKDEASKLLATTLQRIDKAAKANCIHKNTAARKKRQAMKAVNLLG